MEIPQKLLKCNSYILEHSRAFQSLVLDFCNNLQKRSLAHDHSKLTEASEYEVSIAGLQALRRANTGCEDDYVSGWRKKGIQQHICSNDHHPEFWGTKPIPLTRVILIWMDWWSHTIVKNNDFTQFLPYNLAKLEKHQTRAIAIIQALCEEFPDGI